MSFFLSCPDNVHSLLPLSSLADTWPVEGFDTKVLDPVMAKERSRNVIVMSKRNVKAISNINEQI